MKSDNSINQKNKLTAPTRRKLLLPRWIRVCSWFFLVAGSFLPIIYFLNKFGLSDSPISISIYGVSSSEAMPKLTFFLLIIYTLKGIVAYGLLFDKEWGVQLGIWEAVLSIVICILFTAITPFIAEYSFPFYYYLRYELIFIIPFYLKLRQIQSNWENFYNNETRKIML